MFALGVPSVRRRTLAPTPVSRTKTCRDRGHILRPASRGHEASGHEASAVGSLSGRSCARRFASRVSGKYGPSSFAISTSSASPASAEEMQTASSTILSRPSLCSRHSWGPVADHHRRDWGLPVIPAHVTGRVTRDAHAHGGGCSAAGRPPPNLCMTRSGGRLRARAPAP
jgi:hypothetical protein